MKNIAFIILSFVFIVSGCKKQTEQKHLQSFSLTDVEILDGPFYQGQQADLNYILALNPDRLLAPYLKDAGIDPLGENYPNWENTGLDGHIGGHYLSALAFMYAATGNEELMNRIEYMLNGLEKCQIKNGNGYVGGVPNGKRIWEEVSQGNIKAGSFSLNSGWVPLYNIHKIFAGLNDVYVVTGEEKALNMLVKLTDWFYNLTKNLTDEQVQDMLRSEHGGLNDVFVEVYRHTGDKKYLEMARSFSDHAVLDPLLRKEDFLTGMHANTQIPKVIGYKQYADAADSAAWSEAAKFFWNTVVDKWTVSIGGNSVREHFHPADDFSSMVESNQGPETCNTYNMLKLTKLLYLSDPQAKYVNFYERALFNHILSSEHPTKGGFVYFTPMRPRHYRVYSQPQKGFWCCVGSGLENPGRYGEMIYAHDNMNIYVNMFISSKLSWKNRGVNLTQRTEFPYKEFSEMIVQTDSAKTFSINIRKPDWIVDDSFEIKVNGESQPIEGEPFVQVKREWKSGDLIVVAFKMKSTAEFLPDNSPWVSFKYGPIVLGAISDSNNLNGLWADESRMGHEASGKYYPIDESPVIVTNKTDLSGILVPVPNEALHFKFSEKIYPESFQNLTLQPFFEIHEARYIVYWPVIDSAGFAGRIQEIKEKEKAFMALEEITVDKIETGEQQPESDHFFKGEHTWNGYFKDKYWRNTRNYISYKLKTKNKEGKILRITYYGTDKGSLKITTNNVLVDSVTLDGTMGEKFFDVDYPLSELVLNSAENGVFNLKIEATTKDATPRIFEIRLLKEE
ncbi:MAG: glycoside hydrolase family 127 protein [Bacteroidales bacterium]|nr:glycoside hydrolase family 127 protein [Bacteroidales bacterium]MBN2819785.1 glycoside hydrolase family 127 protein [Bacteroidales bacterium]